MSSSDVVDMPDDRGRQPATISPEDYCFGAYFALYIAASHFSHSFGQTEASGFVVARPKPWPPTLKRWSSQGTPFFFSASTKMMLFSHFTWSSFAWRTKAGGVCAV